MAYLAGFENDVFLSYAHIDNVDDGAKTRWVECFGKQLSAKLLKRIGETVSVWWDPRLERSQDFDEVIKKSVKSSAVMVCLVSEAYMKRPYCKQEWQWFGELGYPSTASGRRRILPVLLYNLPFDQWPEPCKGASGYQFFDPRFEQLSRPVDAESSLFSDKQWELAIELAALLDEIKQSRTTAAPELTSKTETPASFRVFLGAASEELAGDRGFLKKELQRQGIEVVSKIPPPYEEKEHNDAARQAIEQADLSVHLLGNLPGTPIDEDAPGKTYAVEQTGIALAHAKSQLILLPESFSVDLIEEPSYAGFVKDVQQRPREPGRLQIVKTGRQQMLEEILAAKKGLDELAAQVKSQKQGAPRTAFVDLHVKDLTYIADLVDYLAGKNIAAVTVPSAQQSPTAGMERFEQYLKSSQLFIVVFGAVARDWVVNRVAEAFKLIMANGLRTPMGIYVAPPEKSPQDVNFSLCNVMINTKKFDPATIETLLGHAARGAA